MDELDARSFNPGAPPFSSPPILLTASENRVIKNKTGGLLFSLDGIWQLAVDGDDRERLSGNWKDQISATVPGSVHTALWKSGIIPDPYFGRNDSIAHRYSFRTYWYKKEFEVKNKSSFKDLLFGGVAIHCTVWLNGVKLGEHEGMFGGPSFEVGKYLKKHNTLIVRINPAPGEARNWNNGGWNSTVVFNCVYGWHYSSIPALGIWRSVSLVEYPRTVIEHPFIATANFKKGEMDLLVPLRSDQPLNGTIAIAVLPENFKGDSGYYEYKVASQKTTDNLHFRFAVPDPQLWWPNNLGKQNLYRLKVSFASHGECSVKEFTFGIRSVKMVPLPGGPYQDKYNWTFEINGERHFIKGTGWCTMDPLMDFNRGRYERQISMAALMNCQMMRAWGGGMPETDDFYDLCDRYGIMIIQEWPTAWNSHNMQPFDALEETVMRNTCRLRNYPSLVMYGGGNESSKPFGKAIDMMGRLSIELDGTRPFHRGEPWGGSNHNYDCYWGKRPLDHNLNMISDFWGEFGLASLPNYQSVNKYLPEDEKDKWPPSPEGSLSHHTPIFGTAEDIARLTQYAGYFVNTGDKGSLKEIVFGSQMAQSVGLRHTLERSRTRWPDCSGALFYKLNDNYPAMAWSTVDWYGVPKMSLYFCKSAFAPLHSVLLFNSINAVADKENSYPVFILDDANALKERSWRVVVKAYDSSLNLLKSNSWAGNGGIGSTKRLGDFLLSSEQVKSAPLFIVSEVLVEDQLADRTFYFQNYENPKGALLNLPRTNLTLVIESSDNVTVKNSGNKPAVGVNIQHRENPETFTIDDNFFWLEPQEEKTIKVNSTKGLEAGAWNVK